LIKLVTLIVLFCGPGFKKALGSIKTPVWQGMPGKELDHMPMHDEMPEAAPDGAKGAQALNTVDELKENIRQFTESVHQKASSLVMWQNQVEPINNERSQKLLHRTECLWW
jgi:hypothetical protein